jgi:FkbM family methyltransferase
MRVSNTVDRALRFWKQNLYRHLRDYRGFTKLSKFLEKIVLRAHFDKNDRTWKVAVNDVVIRFVEPEMALEQIVSRVIEGYTCKRQLESSDVVLDCGSFPGEFAIYAAKICDKVYALEPDKENARKLRRNLEANRIDNCEILETGVWNERGTVGFKKSGLNSKVSENDEFVVDVTTLDRLRERYGPFDSIKMDIEGAELEAIDGAQELLQSGESFFSVASYHKRNGQQTFAELQRRFSEFDYDTETGHESHLTTWAVHD